MFKPSFIVSIYNEKDEPIYYEFSDSSAAISTALKYKNLGFRVRLFQQIPIVK